MIQEHKELLIKDLCMRLPYRVVVDYAHNAFDVHKGHYVKQGSKCILTCYLLNAFISPRQNENGEYIKPYLLFPLSSMTEEQAKELFAIFGLTCPSTEEDYIKINECTGITFFLLRGFDVETHLDKLIDYLNAHHFDYRGLISKGLAIDATGLNIY